MKNILGAVLIGSITIILNGCGIPVQSGSIYNVPVNGGGSTYNVPVNNSDGGTYSTNS